MVGVVGVVGVEAHGRRQNDEIKLIWGEKDATRRLRAENTVFTLILNQKVPIIRDRVVVTKNRGMHVFLGPYRGF